MTPEQVLQHFGGKRATCEALGITRQAVEQWFQVGEVPMTRQYELQVRTAGALQAARASA